VRNGKVSGRGGEGRGREGTEARGTMGDREYLY